MFLVCKGQCKNWCLVFRIVVFLVVRLGLRQSQCRRERGWVFMGLGVWVYSGVYIYFGVFYELLEVRMIYFQELLLCMGYIYFGYYFFIFNVCFWCVIFRRIFLMMFVFQELFTRKEDLDGWFFVIIKDVFIMYLNFFSYFYSVENYLFYIFFAYQIKILFF